MGKGDTGSEQGKEMLCWNREGGRKPSMEHEMDSSCKGPHLPLYLLGMLEAHLPLAVSSPMTCYILCHPLPLLYRECGEKD